MNCVWKWIGPKKDKQSYLVAKIMPQTHFLNRSGTGLFLGSRETNSTLSVIRVPLVHPPIIKRNISVMIKLLFNFIHLLGLALSEREIIRGRDGHWSNPTSGL
jgi:hypothetical protein